MDSPSSRVLRFGEGSSGGAIHRCVWTPEAVTTADAVDTVNRLVLQRLQGHVPAGEGRVLDLGCGVGATMVRLSQGIDARVTGVTISREQAAIGAQRLAMAEVDDRCDIVCADFSHLPDGPCYHAIVAIEAVLYAPSMPELIPSLAARLEPGGRLILCDDWLTDSYRGLASRERCLAQFRTGWRTGRLHTVAEIEAMAERAGLCLAENLDLTSYLRLGRPRDRVISLIVGTTRALPGAHDRMVENPFWANMIGGAALQTGLSRGWLEYRLLVLERQQ